MSWKAYWYFQTCLFFKPIPVTAWSTEWVFGRLFAGIAGSHPAGGMEVCLSKVLSIVR